MFLYKNKDSSFFSAFVDVISSIFMCSMTLTAALFITLGFNVWCGEMTRRFENCADATENDIDRAEGIDPKGFFMQMFTAQFGVWLSWATWCGLTVFALLKLCRYHQQENIRVMQLSPAVCSALLADLAAQITRNNGFWGRLF